MTHFEDICKNMDRENRDCTFGLRQLLSSSELNPVEKRALCKKIRGQLVSLIAECDKYLK